MIVAVSNEGVVGRIQHEREKREMLKTLFGKSKMEKNLWRPKAR